MTMFVPELVLFNIPALFTISTIKILFRLAVINKSKNKLTWVDKLTKKPLGI